jgi:hypothetical protein
MRNISPFLLIVGFFYSAFCFAQFTSSKDVFGTRNFIENKGQFNSEIKNGGDIKFAYQSGREKIYFTTHGLIYKIEEQIVLSEKQRERIEEGRKPNLKGRTEEIGMEWSGANENLQIVPGEKQDFYFTYGDGRLNSFAFKKLTYKNVYPYIDIEYTIPENKNEGIKYTVVVYPGGNVNDVQIAYSGDVKKVSGINGEVRITSSLTEITEHKPLSFYKNGESAPSDFRIKKNLISFSVPDYDKTKTLLIDPWVTTFTMMAPTNCAYDVDYDFKGNLFAFGGYQNAKLAKYDANGSLKWVFNGNLPSISWSTDGDIGGVANFVVNKGSGKCYLGSPFEYSGTRVVRLDTNGNYDNFVTTPASTMRENWDFTYDCSTGSICVFGGGTYGNSHAAILDPAVPTMTLVNLSGLPNPSQDVSCSTIDASGNVFLYFTGPTLNNKIMRVNNTFTGYNWLVQSPYVSFSEANTKTLFPMGVPVASSNGFNSLAVNSTYLYVYDGRNLTAYAKATGSMVSTLTIQTQTLGAQGGIACDDCGNIYLGGQGTIEVYNFNGNMFSWVSSMPLSVPNQTSVVTDIRMNAPKNLLYVSGQGFVGTYPASQSLGCMGLNQFLLSSVCNGVNNGSAAVTVTTGILNPVFDYIWTLGNNTVSAVTGSTLNSNSVSNLANGIYSLQVFINGSCGSVYVNTVNINCCQPYTVIPTGSLSNCPNTLSISFAGTGTVVPSVTWSPVPLSLSGNSLVATGLPPGTTTIISAFGAGCQSITTINVPSPSYPSVSISGGGTICAGAQVYLTASGAPSYSWNNGSTNNIIAVAPTVTSVYTVTGTAANGCTAAASATVIVSICSGMEKIVGEMPLKIFPNPNSGKFSIVSVEEIQFTLFNQLGQIAASGKLNSDNSYTGEIEGLEEGIYYLSGHSGKKSFSYKILVLKQGQ